MCAIPRLAWMEERVQKWQTSRTSTHVTVFQGITAYSVKRVRSFIMHIHFIRNAFGDLPKSGGQRRISLVNYLIRHLSEPDTIWYLVRDKVNLKCVLFIAKIICPLTECPLNLHVLKKGRSQLNVLKEYQIVSDHDVYSSGCRSLTVCVQIDKF